MFFALKCKYYVIDLVIINLNLKAALKRFILLEYPIVLVADFFYFSLLYFSFGLP